MSTEERKLVALDDEAIKEQTTSSHIPPLRSKSLPYDLEAEQACIGSMLIKNSLFDKIFSQLKSSDFYDERHQIIVDCIVKHRIEHGLVPIDIVTLASLLQNNKKLELCGGKKYLMELNISVPTIANIDFYVNIVKEKNFLRRIINISTTSIKQSLDNKDSHTIIEKAQQDLYELAINNYQDYLSAEQMSQEGFELVEKICRGEQDMGLPTHFRDLDKSIKGLKKSNLIIIGGRTSMGKTAFALSLLLRIARTPITTKTGEKNISPVGLFSLEMSNSEIYLRLLSSLGNIPINELDMGAQNDNPRHWDAIVKANDEMRQLPIFIDDTPGITIDELRFKARQMVQRDHVKMIVIDYLQLITSLDNSFSRELQISNISKQLKNLARELDVPIITLTQLNRAAEYREDKTPRLSDIRESGAIEQDADLVMFLHRPHYDKVRTKQISNETDTDVEYPEQNEDHSADERVANIIIAKNRQGPTGKITLDFDAKFMRFSDMVHMPEQDWS